MLTKSNVLQKSLQEKGAGPANLHFQAILLALGKLKMQVCRPGPFFLHLEMQVLQARPLFLAIYSISFSF